MEVQYKKPDKENLIMSKNVNKIALAISMAMASVTSVYAQEVPQAPDGIENIEKVVVVGEKTARSLKETTSSIALIAEDEINSMRYKSIHDAVRHFRAGSRYSWRVW